MFSETQESHMGVYREMNQSILGLGLPECVHLIQRPFIKNLHSS